MAFDQYFAFRALLIETQKFSLLEAVVRLFSSFSRGKVWDIGAGSGVFSNRLQQLGFDVTAADKYAGHFDFKFSISFDPFGFFSNIVEEAPFFA